MGTKMVGVIFSQIMQSVDHNIYAAMHSTLCRHDICNDYDDDMNVFPSVAGWTTASWWVK